MTVQKGIDVCICTFNRVDYLRQCVESLLPQLNSEVVITIIDNNSTDATGSYVNTLVEKNYTVRYFLESNQGLSYARNRGWKESKQEWIFYMDDDCLPESNILKNAQLAILNHPEADALGGPIYPVFSTSRPSWLPHGFGKFNLPFEKFTLIDNGYLRGGCFLVKRSVLESLGGFKTYLGVKGNTLGYGEEIELQDRMRSAGYKVGYDPMLKMGHHVRAEKLNVNWILQSEYARRRDKMAFEPKSILEVTINLLRTTGSRFIWIPVHLMKMSTNRKYSSTNFKIDSLAPLAYRWGEFVGVIKRRKRLNKS